MTSVLPASGYVDSYFVDICSAIYSSHEQGHDILMATMLNGAAIMDGALLLIAANESCPQPQTSEHLAAVEIMRLQHIIILQNKIDLIQESAAMNQHEAIQKFIQVSASRFLTNNSQYFIKFSLVIIFVCSGNNSSRCSCGTNICTTEVQH